MPTAARTSRRPSSSCTRSARSSRSRPLSPSSTRRHHLRRSAPTSRRCSGPRSSAASPRRRARSPPSARPPSASSAPTPLGSRLTPTHVFKPFRLSSPVCKSPSSCPARRALFEACATPTARSSSGTSRASSRSSAGSRARSTTPSSSRSSRASRASCRRCPRTRSSSRSWCVLLSLPPLPSFFSSSTTALTRLVARRSSPTRQSPSSRPRSRA